VFGTDSAEDGEVVGFIDVGTNSIHLLVVKYYEGTLGTMIFQDKESVRLGQSLYSTGMIDAATEEKARVVISDFAAVARRMGAERVIAVATCAVRESPNKKALLDAIRVEGVELSIVPGAEEARLIRLGVFGPTAPPYKCLEIDIGGGSTEIILCQGTDDYYLDSLDMGAVRFAYGSGVPHDRALTFAEYDQLRREVDRLSYYSCRKVKEYGFSVAYGSSGTMMALAEMCGIRRGDNDGTYMMYYEVVELMKEIYTKDIEGRCGIPGMNSGRTDIIVGGGAIAEELMYLMGIDRIEISTNGLKQGMQVDYLIKKGNCSFNVREASIYALANRCGYDRKHAEFVKDTALKIFDRLKDLGIHKVGNDMRELLEYAALLHDVGEFINYPKHHVLSYIIITNSYLVGFTSEELRAIGLITRFHHKKFPDMSSKILSDIPVPEREEILICALILKISDILDRRHNSSVKSLEINIVDDTMMIDIGSDTDVSMEAWKLMSIDEDIMRLFGKHLKVIRS
jgi:exopolyphosphatase/guanosine-5'-triphosphate,3'-diphosphate pyrophosphatase